ncbi:MAG: bifunctional folylpolyglutamate synthase/dihydrofolate synthase [Rickettsiales bacterium]|nr:bifunctional folylpolyglutamate synthase/dihydrofolate synthase [Rickettsiales bacterium]
MVWLPHWPVVNAQLKPSLGLTRILSLLKALKSPHLKLPPVIHIAGTNGKGSTIAFMRAIFEAAGLEIHRYTSPHLLRFNERILLAGQEIQDDYLFSLLEECRLTSEQHNIPISFFEGITTAAFLAFSRHKADVVLLEVGLGGRLDATNVIDKPLISVITPISYDHQDILGAKLEQIAYEKACIIKPNCPCVISMQTKSVHNVIQAFAQKQKSPLIRYEHEFGVSITKTNTLEYKSAKRNLITQSPALFGYHQYVNAATAIAAIETCYTFSNKIFETGITKAKWLGRLTNIKNGKLFNILAKNTELWIDTAHNEGGAQALATWLADQPEKETILILGMTKNRNINKFLKYFKGLITKIICVNVYSEPMSYKSETMVDLIVDSHLKTISTHVKTLHESFNYIKKITSKKSTSRVLITGSIFLISDFLRANNSEYI